MRFILGFIGAVFAAILLISFFSNLATYFQSPPAPMAAEEFHREVKELRLASDGPLGKFGPDDDPRHALVDWMAKPDNPFFARALVNRMWGHFLGRGLYHEVDDLPSYDLAPFECVHCGTSTVTRSFRSATGKSPAGSYVRRGSPFK